MTQIACLKGTIVVAISSVLLFQACAPGPSGKGAEPHDSAREVSVTDSFEKIVATSWCRIDSRPNGLHLMKRLNFYQEPEARMEVSFIRLDRVGAPIVYNDPVRQTWQPGSSAVALIQNERDVRKIATSHTSSPTFVSYMNAHTSLDARPESFLPQFALLLNTNAAAPTSPETYFPCLAYGADFEAREPVRRMMELNILLAQPLPRFKTR